MTKTRKQKQNDIYTVVIEYDKNCKIATHGNCKIATHGECFSEWKGTVLRNKKIVFSCDIELRYDVYKKKAFLETFEVFMRYKKGEKLNYVENVVYVENLDK